jgi:hypothetical protein
LGKLERDLSAHTTAIEAGATLFVTNDRRLAKVQDLDVLLLDDYVV